MNQRAILLGRLSLLSLLLTALSFSALGCHSISPEEEMSASQASLLWLTEKYGKISEPEATRFTEAVVERLSHAANSLPIANAPAQRWSIVVIGGKEQNAFSLGSGIIVITKALALNLRSEAGFAAVIAHEMSHYYLGHTSQALASAAKQHGVPQYSYSETQEFEADALSVKLLYAARYDPRHAQLALELAYRPQARVVDSAEWLNIRERNLDSEIRKIGSFYPATQNTRDFERFRLILAGRR